MMLVCDDVSNNMFFAAISKHELHSLDWGNQSVS